MLLHNLITPYKYVFVSTIHYHQPVPCISMSITHKQSLLSKDIFKSTAEPNLDVSFRDTGGNYKYTQLNPHLMFSLI
jgi:hypothetical protein